MKKILPLIALFICTTLFSQNRPVPNYHLEVLNPNSNYNEITNAVEPILIANQENAVTKTEKKNAEKALKQFGRWQYFWKERTDSQGNITLSGGEDELSRISPNTPFSEIFNTQQNNQKSNNNSPWVQVGPTTSPNPHGYVAFPGQGLINVIRPLTGTVALAGASNGGIWKTDDITSTTPNWTPKTDYLARIGIVDIKAASNNSIYALTGDRDAQDRSKSIGVIKSTDAGDNWATTSLVLDPTQIAYISNLGMKPNDNNKMFFAVNSASGIKQYATTDGWATHQEYNNNNLQYANDVLYTNDFILVSNIFGRIFKSEDDGVTFTQIYDNEEGAGNIVLRFNQSHNSGDVYFLAAKKNGAKVYKLTTSEILNATGVISATQVGTDLTTYEPQGLYNVAFSVSSVDANRIFVLGVNGWYTKDAGSTWTMKLDAYNSQNSGETYVHPDHHFITHTTGSKWWLTHDGGITELDMTTFDTSSGVAGAVDKTNNLQIGQIYHSAITDSATFTDALLGLQDNDGMSISPNTQSGNWVAVQAGDGTAAAISPTNPLVRLIGGTRGALSRTTTAYQANSNDQTTILPANNDALFAGKAIFHNTNGNFALATWAATGVSYNGGAGFGYLTEVQSLGQTQEMDLWDSRCAVIGANGQSHLDVNSTLMTFSNVQTITQPSGVTQNFNSICVNSATSGVTYATISGYDAANKVFRSTDNGVTWTNITHNLPNVVMKKVLNKVTDLGGNDEILFLGTEVGVYYKLGAASTNWIKLGNNLPNVTVTDMSINYAQKKLYAATFGRGFWSINIDNNTLSNDDLTLALESALKVYPVPSSNNNVLVKLPNNIDEANYSIYSYIGSKIVSGSITTTNNKLNTYALSAGSYIVVFNINETQVSKKIIIK
ncbi:T9SS type A sorting domain-containing protein [Lacinutrix sp. Bg11-31]|uniref:T9SS type A sorting domain-containing protein n=1 Tax=Lacinutrix sp. Bg11-31 TaxID=2057808 RepID=UPI0012FD8F53|nr:T9SS type A sorting domain-containing protein [Lacinutrix sp. Bg11-31]